MSLHVRKRWSTILLCAALALAPRNGYASPEEARVAAQLLKNRATEAMGRGDLVGARELFREAYDRFPSPNLLFNLGVVLLKLGDELGAADALSRFLADGAGAQKDALKFSQEHLEELERRLGRARVAVDVAEVELSLDGRPLGRSPLAHAIWAVAGSHRIEAVRSGYPTIIDTCVIAAGQIVDCVVAMKRRAVVDPVRQPTVEVPARTLVSSAPAKRAPQKRSPWLWVGVGAGVVVAGTAIALGVVFGTRTRYPTPTVGSVDAN